MPYNIQNLLDDISLLLIDLDKELTNRRLGIDADGSIGQLEHTIEELKSIEKMAINNTLPPKEMRRTAYSWYITDSWSHNSELGSKLLKLADKYRRKLR